MHLGTSGHPDQLSKDLIGATVNLAFRINAWAGSVPSRVVADDAVVREFERFDGTRRHDRVELKGFGEPRALWELPG